MRKILLLFLLAPVLAWGQQKTVGQKPITQPTNKQIKWEYFIYKVNPTPRDYEADYISGNYEDKEANFFNPDINVMDSLGCEGWELVNTYTELYTLYPNFGQEGYHTGIKENVKIKNICFVFKRSYTGEQKPKPKLGDNGFEVKPRKKRH